MRYCDFDFNVIYYQIDDSNANLIINEAKSNVLLEVAPYPRPTYGYVPKGNLFFLLSN